MLPLDRALVISYRLSIVTMSLTAAVWPQFATPVFRGGIGRLNCIGSYVNKQVTTFTFREQATTCSKHHTRTVMDAGCECAPWVRSANPSDNWALVYYVTTALSYSVVIIAACGAWILAMKRWFSWALSYENVLRWSKCYATHAKFATRRLWGIYTEDHLAWQVLGLCICPRCVVGHRANHTVSVTSRTKIPIYSSFNGSFVQKQTNTTRKNIRLSYTKPLSLSLGEPCIEIS